MITIFSSLLFLIGSSHDIQVAYFKIHQEENAICIDFVFELDDVVATFEEQKKTLTDEHFKKYLEKHFSLRINNEVQNFTFEEMQFKSKHIRLRGNLQKIEQPIKSIILENTCLLNIDNHSNIIEIKLFEQERDFLMNKHRTEINVTY